MVRRASWRTLAPSRDRTFARRLWHAAVWRLQASALLYVALSFLTFLGFAATIPSTIVIAGLLALGASTLRDWRRWLLNAPPRPSRPELQVGHLLTLPPPATPYPCRIELWRGSCLLGEDVGVATFLDAWLHFEGHRTSFAISSSNVVRTNLHTWARVIHRDGCRFWLVAGGELVVRPDDALIVGDYREFDLRSRFRTEIARWITAEPPDVPPRLPPLRTDRSAVARAKSDLAVEAILVAPGVLCAAGLSFVFGPMGGIALAIPLCGLTLTSVRLVESIVRLRRELDQLVVE